MVWFDATRELMVMGCNDGGVSKIIKSYSRVCRVFLRCSTVMCELLIAAS